MIYTREDILAARADMPQSWKRTARWRMGSEIDAIDKSEAASSILGGFDWTAQTALGASYSDFDRQALSVARKCLEHLMGTRAERMKRLDMPAMLTKVGAMVNGVPTHGALLLLGKPSSDAHMAGLAPRILYKRYNEKGKLQQPVTVRMPFLLGVDQLVESICADGSYPADDVRELLVNAVVHCDYLLRGNIEVTDRDGRLTISNPGSFSLGTPSSVMDDDFSPYPMRNAALCRLMIQCDLMDAMGLGIAFVQNDLRIRKMQPLSYDLTDGESVSVTMHALSGSDRAPRKDARNDRSEASLTELIAEGNARKAERNAGEVSSPADRATHFDARIASADSRAAAAAPDIMTSDDLDDIVADIVAEGHGVTRAEVVDELDDRGVSGVRDNVRKVSRSLVRLQKAGRIHKGEGDTRHWYA